LKAILPHVNFRGRFSKLHLLSTATELSKNGFTFMDVGGETRALRLWGANRDFGSTATAFYVTKAGIIMLPESIRTARLHLRKPQLADAESVWSRYAQDPEVSKYLIWKPHRQMEDTQKFIQSRIDHWTAHTSYPWVMTEASTGTVIGMIEAEPNGHMVSIGYVLERPSWGKGVMTEALRAVIAALFHVPSIYRVWATCDLENVASVRVLEKAGMQREGILRQWTIHPNISDRPRDCFCYSVIRSEMSGSQMPR
jgi:[ribosomal protein S5]-alanine N-acetyltransferase